MSNSNEVHSNSNFEFLNVIFNVWESINNKSNKTWNLPYVGGLIHKAKKMVSGKINIENLFNITRI